MGCFVCLSSDLESCFLQISYKLLRTLEQIGVTIIDIGVSATSSAAGGLLWRSVIMTHSFFGRSASSE